MSSQAQLKRDLESILESLNSTGTKLLFEDWQKFHDQIVNNAADQCDTSEKWHQRRGEIAAMRFVLSAKAQVESALKNLAEHEQAPKEPERNPLED